MSEAIFTNRRDKDQPMMMKPSREKYESLVRQLLPDLHRIALRLTQGSRDLAEDIVQDALIKGYQLYMNQKLILEENSKAWFIKVMTNNFLIHLRKEKRIDHETVISDQNLNQPHVVPESRQGNPESLTHNQLDAVFEDALATLPEEQRVCIILIDLEEMSFQEVASILEIPTGTVKSRVSRARIKLASILYPHYKRSNKGEQS